MKPGAIWLSGSGIPLLVGLLATVLAGCGRGQAPIPAGAQQVHVTASEARVRLDPATARAGDVYVVLDTPRSSVGFVQRKRTADETPGPLADDDVARIAGGGDTQGFAMSGFDLVGCDDAQRAEDLGQQGPCGNVFKVVLSAGTYAFFSGALEEGPPRSMAILEVAP